MSRIIIGETQRGFPRGEFKDRYGESCSIQDSSLATEAAIWLGLDDLKPKIMARDALKMGREDLLDPPGTPDRFNGWVEYKVPKEVTLACRMHLTIDDVKALLPILERFVRTGTIRPKS